MYFKMENVTHVINSYLTDPNEADLEPQLINISNDTQAISSVKKNNSVMHASLMFTFGFLGNVLALVVLIRSPSDQKRKLFYRLVAGLTLTDLIGTTATSPFVIAAYVNDFKWVGGMSLCRYFAFMMIFAGTATTTIICIMSVERLICIRHPYLYHAQLRKKHATIFLLGAWTFAGAIASLPLIGFGEIVFHYPNTWCFFDYYTKDSVNRGFNYLFAILTLLTICVTVTCNGIVLYTLLITKMKGLSRKFSRDSRTFSGYSRKYAECQMAVLLIGITIVFSTCYLPLMVRILINQTNLLPKDRITDLLMIRLASLNQILDPWVYILLRREVVWSAASTVKKIFSKQSEENTIENQFRRQDSTVFASDVQYSCCEFCWHCLCDPPQTARPSSFYYSEYGRNSYHSRQNSPTNRLAMNVIPNVLVTNSTANGKSPTHSDRRSQVIKELQHQASIDSDPVSEQPKSVLIKLNPTNSIFRHDNVCSCLLNSDDDEIKPLNGEDI
ncbi:Prostaglandin E2 receptor EP4 subtype [Mactra antiquata]